MIVLMHMTANPKVMGLAEVTRAKIRHRAYLSHGSSVSGG
jgi:hypothetical protein